MIKQDRQTRYRARLREREEQLQEQAERLTQAQENLQFAIQSMFRELEATKALIRRKKNA